MSLYHDSRSETYRRPYGAAAVSTRVALACDSDAESVTLRLWSEAGERLLPCARREDGRFAVAFDTPEEGCVLYYAFRTPWEESAPRQITVYKPAPVPAWWKEALVYQIFPDRFAREADWAFRQPEKRRGTRRFTVPDWDTPVFYAKDEAGAVSSWPFWGGTLRGVAERLPYLESLGVTCLYLNPIFAAASNHRYDTADYFRVDPLLGTEADFTQLCREARARGMRVILDGVFNHTGADSRYFDKYGNYGTAADYKSWFRFGAQYRHGYECWWDVPDLPNVEENDPGYRAFICGEDGVVRYWMRRGASGWRLDVADELPDDFIRAIRRAVKAEDPEGVLLGEVWEDASNKVSYGELRRYFQGEELDATMHYPFRTAALDFLTGRSDAAALRETLETLREHYPPENQLAALNLVSSHDRERALTLLGGDRALFKLLTVLPFACPGVPCIYYGDEAGMTGGPDPYNRAPFPWGREDQELTAHIRALAALYAAHSALRGGDTAYLARGADVFGVERRDKRERVTVWIDRAAGSWRLE